MWRAFLAELAITAAGLSLTLTHFPSYEPSVSKVLAQEDIESRIDFPCDAIADESEGVEAVNDGVYLGRREPAVCAVCLVSGGVVIKRREDLV